MADPLRGHRSQLEATLRELDREELRIFEELKKYKHQKKTLSPALQKTYVNSIARIRRARVTVHRQSSALLVQSLTNATARAQMTVVQCLKDAQASLQPVMPTEKEVKETVQQWDQAQEQQARVTFALEKGLEQIETASDHATADEDIDEEQAATAILEELGIVQNPIHSAPSVPARAKARQSPPATVVKNAKRVIQ